MAKQIIHVTLDLGKDGLRDPILHLLASHGKITEPDLVAAIQKHYETTPEEVRETLEDISIEGQIDYFRGLAPREVRITEKGRDLISLRTLANRQADAIERIMKMKDGPEKRRQLETVRRVHS